MKKLLVFVIALGSCLVSGYSAAGQSHAGSTRQTTDTTIVPVNNSGLPVLQLRDTTIVRINRPARVAVKAGGKKKFRISCGCGIAPHAPPAIYIDGKLADSKILNSIPQQDIKNIKIPKSDSLEIDGKIYKGIIYVETKKGMAI